MGKRNRAKRNTYNYELKQGRKVVYRGITTNPERRYREHKRVRKRFTHMLLNPFPCSRSTARKREKKSIERYVKTRGRRPRYNKVV